MKKQKLDWTKPRENWLLLFLGIMYLLLLWSDIARFQKEIPLLEKSFSLEELAVRIAAERYYWFFRVTVALSFIGLFLISLLSSNAEKEGFAKACLLWAVGVIWITLGGLNKARFVPGWLFIIGGGALVGIGCYHLLKSKKGKS